MEKTYKFIFLSLTLALFTLSACGSSSQLAQNKNATTSTSSDSIPLIHTQFTIDRFDALYIVSPDDELIKLNTDYKIEFRYSNSRLGAISSIDASNPLANVCFYQDFQAIVLLDRTLNPISQINLGDWGFNNVTAACNADNNQLWVYDASDMQLAQIAKDRHTPIRTFPINLLSDEPFVVIKMLVNKENLYCLSAKGDIYKISLIGEFLQKILSGEYSDFQFSGNRLLVLDQKGQISLYQNAFELKPLNYPLAQKGKWGMLGGRLILGNGHIIWMN